MAIVLENSKISLTIETAGENYTGSRFDWNGTIVSAKFNGIETLGEEKKLFHRNKKIFGRGMHNEFGIKRPIGYDEAAQDGLFPKIGTGWLKKNDVPYFFYTQYPVKPLDFDYALAGDDGDGENPTKAIFFCNSGSCNGYAYEYTKEITLLENGFSTKYTLKNTGEKTLETDEYVHNFLRLGKSKTKKGQKLIFGWEIEEAKLIENINPSNTLKINKNEVVFLNTPKNKEFFLGGLSGEAVINEDSKIQGKWTLVDENLGISMSETCDFNIEKADLWGHSEAISPELFYSFSIKPGETTSWTRTIEYAEL